MRASDHFVDGSKLPHGRWDLNLGPLQGHGQQALFYWSHLPAPPFIISLLLSPDPSLNSQCSFIYYSRVCTFLIVDFAKFYLFFHQFSWFLTESKSLAEQEPCLFLCYAHSTCTVWHLSRGEVRHGWHTVGSATLVSCRKSIHKIAYGRECSHSN